MYWYSIEYSKVIVCIPLVKLNCYATSIRNIHISREIKRFKPCEGKISDAARKTKIKRDKK